MMHTWNTLILLSGCLPLFSSVIWMTMITLSVYDNNTRQERKIKQILILFFLFTAGGWIFTLAYTYTPQYAVYFNVIGYLSYMMVPVKLYCFLCSISTTETIKPFSLWHYAIPLSISVILLIWSFFIPYDIQLLLIEGRGKIVPEYKAYSYLFLSKPIMRIIYTLVYSILFLIRLRYYYISINNKETKLRKPARWIKILSSFIIVILLITIAAYLLPRGEIIKSPIVILLILFLVAEHLILGYNVIHRNFLLYVPVKNDINENKMIFHETKTGLIFTGKYKTKEIKKKQFENYMQKYKPWLNPEFKITDLSILMQVNRSAISKFINNTYGINFNRYINRLRLEETERLKKQSSNSKKKTKEIIQKAGFANTRNYMRALKAEQQISDISIKKDTDEQ